MKKLTEWYTSETKPVRVGVYQVAYWGKQQPSYSYWDGRVWGPSYCPTNKLTLKFASNRSDYPNSNQSLPWRGLVK